MNTSQRIAGLLDVKLHPSKRSDIKSKLLSVIYPSQGPVGFSGYPGKAVPEVGIHAKCPL